MSAINSIRKPATKINTNTVKPSKVLNLRDDSVRNSSFLLSHALKEASRTRHTKNLFDCKPLTPAAEVKNVVETVLGLKAVGIEAMRLYQWQLELVPDQRVMLYDGRYAVVDRVWEWIGDYADRPLEWTQFFAMYALIADGNGYDLGIVYPWDCIAKIDDDEYNALQKAGYPADLNRVLEVLLDREV